MERTKDNVRVDIHRSGGWFCHGPGYGTPALRYMQVRGTLLAPGKELCCRLCCCCVLVVLLAACAVCYQLTVVVAGRSTLRGRTRCGSERALTTGVNRRSGGCSRHRGFRSG